MKISLPSINQQKKLIYEEATKEAIKQLKKNLTATPVAEQTEIKESDFSHLLREHEGWVEPKAEVVRAYFSHFQELFPEYSTDKALARFLGLSSDRRIREMKAGDRKVPYGVWRKLLIVTGRVPQDVLTVLCITQ